MAEMQCRMLLYMFHVADVKALQNDAAVQLAWA